MYRYGSQDVFLIDVPYCKINCFTRTELLKNCIEIILHMHKNEYESSICIPIMRAIWTCTKKISVDTLFWICLI